MPTPLPAAFERPGEVVTFYSYKGGTGRTMALSNIAVLLARRENASVPVLMLDWDMEAPGLHHYFEQHEERPGVLEFFEACRQQLERISLETAGGRAGGQARGAKMEDARMRRWPSACSTPSTGSSTWCASTRAARCT